MEINLTSKAQKEFSRLPPPTQKKIEKKLLFLETNPFLGKQLGGELALQRSVKAWPYRIIYWIDKKGGKTWILSITHRQGAYKK